ncbi:MAG TPA: hypothetical protein VFN02_11650, partial [Ktedonobacteraceae bacterium]|nr:hypothetical protein [Ktedonobacteraceae bacterium]
FVGRGPLDDAGAGSCHTRISDDTNAYLHTSIYSKIQVSSRGAATRYAMSIGQVIKRRKSKVC